MWPELGPQGWWCHSRVGGATILRCLWVWRLAASSKVLKYFLIKSLLYLSRQVYALSNKECFSFLNYFHSQSVFGQWGKCSTKVTVKKEATNREKIIPMELKRATIHWYLHRTPRSRKIQELWEKCSFIMRILILSFSILCGIPRVCLPCPSSVVSFSSCFWLHRATGWHHQETGGQEEMDLSVFILLLYLWHLCWRW